MILVLFELSCITKLYNSEFILNDSFIYWLLPLLFVLHLFYNLDANILSKFINRIHRIKIKIADIRLHKVGGGAFQRG